MKKFKAFTLIETLIVIVVFCIGILAVLTGLSQTLRNKDYANIQIKSAFFAREGIELLFNMRDANYHKELPWNCVFNRNDNIHTVNIDNNSKATEELFCDGGYFEPGTILKIGMGSGNEYLDVEIQEMNFISNSNFDEIFSGYQIYYHTGSNIIGNETGFIYNHDKENGGEETRFARYLLITGVNIGDTTNVDDKLLKIESHVLYKKGYLTGEKVMETFIGNYEFNQ